MAKRPNKKRKKEYEVAVEHGCILCKILYGVKTECEIHHLTGAGLALRNEEKFIPLCVHHHRGQGGVHHNTKDFENKYGTQEELWEIYQQEIKETI
jgi:hypothetical protein